MAEEEPGAAFSPARRGRCSGHVAGTDGRIHCARNIVTRRYRRSSGLRWWGKEFGIAATASTQATRLQGWQYVRARFACRLRGSGGFCLVCATDFERIADRFFSFHRGIPASNCGRNLSKLIPEHLRPRSRRTSRSRKLSLPWDSRR